MKHYIIYTANWTWDIECGIKEILAEIKATSEENAILKFNRLKPNVFFNHAIHRVKLK
tara:strand:- start:673 stop:846 length:174 start_codon:yes stop_codon:yes gene_type:complete